MFIFYKMLSFFLFIFSFIFLILGGWFLKIELSVYIDWEILMLNSSVICMTMIFDYMSLIFMGCVLFISSMVLFYSDSYMMDDLYKLRFLILVFLFIISMMFMIISPNMISILLGWDGLGLVSYCLVIFFQNIKSYNSGMLTIITNRIGDVCILICISWMMNFGGWSFIYYMYFFDDFMYYMYMLVILAAFTKSAQIPFSSWLPAAMAAPTPVSALVHSSTLVTAGVYLLIRFSPLLKFYDCSFFIMISILTMFMSGLGANFEFDLKKIIALSTLSQLGLMMSILFIGFPKLAFFHLLTHAFFKALLFLCAGLIIHVMNNSQDIREMGFVSKMLPWTTSSFIISSFSLSGIPFMSGFYSKDMVVEFFFYYDNNFLYYIIFMICICLTMSYSIRLFNYLMIYGSGNYCYQSYYEDNIMSSSMFLLVIFSIFWGWLLSMLLYKTPFFYISSFLIKLMPLISVIIGLMLGMFFSHYYFDNMNLLMNNMLFYMGSMWYMPYFSTYVVYSIFLYFSKYYYKLMDMGWGEFLFSKSHLSLIYLYGKLNYILEYNNIKLFMIFFLIFIMLLFI